MTGFAVDFLIVLYQNAVVEEGDPGRREQLVTIKFSGLKDDIKLLPFTGRTRDVYQGRRLTVDGSALAIGV